MIPWNFLNTQVFEVGALQQWKAFLTTKNCEEYGLVWSDEVGLGMPGCCREIGNHHRRALMEYFKYEDVHIRIARSSLPSNTPTLTPS